MIISREYTFDAAHRINGHPKCGRLHGHTYHVAVYVTHSDYSYGMLLDYAKLDEIVKPIIDTLDHRYMVPEFGLAFEPYAAVAADRQDLVVLHGCRTSTAEELARYIGTQIQQLAEDMLRGIEGDDPDAVFAGIRIDQVVVHETPKSAAIWQPNREV